ncbi:MAG: DNA-binding protein Alba [Euryarchaeota archaeon]|nr:DNA-binding protein Alba [Euryarchaeota archaeon]MBU4139869.1 DNA-binding protein Alba [Euryarchaeota archaeon]
MTDNNVVYVGSKPVMNYVLAVVKEFNNGASEVILKARGKAISRAVDAAEVSRNRFLTETKINGITIGTEKMQSENGPSNVSIIEIVIGK